MKTRDWLGVVALVVILFGILTFIHYQESHFDEVCIKAEDKVVDSKENNFGVFFKDPTFQAQFLRTVGYTANGGAEIGECYRVGSLIIDGDRESWYENWSAMANRIYSMTRESVLRGHRVSARGMLIRASNYFRTAALMIENNPTDPRMIEIWRKQADTFKESLQFFSSPVEQVQIPFEGMKMAGHFYLVDDSGERRPTLIVVGGADGTLEELYFTAEAALKRGYNCLTFDGPGQGGVLRLQKIPFRPDWENVVKVVVDYLLTRSEVEPKKIAILGRSFGGYFAARAVTGEHRIAACIVDPGIYDNFENAVNQLPTHVQEMFGKKDSEGLDRFFEEILSKNEQFRFKFEFRMWRYGVNSPRKLIEGVKEFTLKGRVQNVTCPVLVCDNEQEYLSRGQAKRLYEELPQPKTYLLFTSAEGAGGHSQPLSPQLFAEKIYNWLDDTLQLNTSRKISRVEG